MHYSILKTEDTRHHAIRNIHTWNIHSYCGKWYIKLKTSWYIMVCHGISWYMVCSCIQNDIAPSEYVFLRLYFFIVPKLSNKPSQCFLNEAGNLANLCNSKELQQCQLIMIVCPCSQVWDDKFYPDAPWCCSPWYQESPRKFICKKMFSDPWASEELPATKVAVLVTKSDHDVW